MQEYDSKEPFKTLFCQIRRWCCECQSSIPRDGSCALGPAPLSKSSPSFSFSLSIPPSLCVCHSLCSNHHDPEYHHSGILVTLWFSLHTRYIVIWKILTETSEPLAPTSGSVWQSTYLTSFTPQPVYISRLF